MPPTTVYVPDEVLPIRMPNIRHLMEQGTTFSRAVTNSPLCVPARACLALGQNYEHCGTWNNDYCCPTERPSFYRILREGGYVVSGVGKFDLHKPIMHWGENGQIPPLERLGFSRAFENEGKGDAVWAYRHGCLGTYGKYMQEKGLMEAYAVDHLRRATDPLDSAPADISAEDYADNWVTENALSELRALTAQPSPWFLMVNFSGPHDPWDITDEMKRAWTGVEFPVPPEFTGDKERLIGVRQNYAAMLENIDRNIGRLMEALQGAGQYEDTIIIYSADHGEMLGDRNRFFKSVPYRPSVHIPLVISGKGFLRNRVCDELVQLHDLAATIVEFADLSMPGDVDSQSLRAFVTNPKASPVRDYQYAALYTHLYESDDPIKGYEQYESFRKRHRAKNNSWRSISTKRFKYIEYLATNERELYDISVDPREQNNIVRQCPEEAERLKKMMDEIAGEKIHG